MQLATHSEKRIGLRCEYYSTPDQTLNLELGKALLLAMRSGKLVAILHDMYYVCYVFEIKVYDPILVYIGNL